MNIEQLKAIHFRATIKPFGVLVAGLLMFNSLMLAASEDLPSLDNTVTKSVSLLWIAPYQKPERAPIYQAFKSILNSDSQLALNFEIRYQPFVIGQDLSSQLNSSYDFIITAGDHAWLSLKDTSVSAKKIGLMLSEPLFRELTIQNPEQVYAISSQQPAQRFFALIQAMNFYQTQTASFFTKQQIEQKLLFENTARTFDVPFMAMEHSSKTSILEASNSIDACCRVLLVKSQDFGASLAKQKALMMNSYKNKIIVIGDSRTLLKQGAMVVLFSQPHQIGQQAAEMVRDILTKKNLKPFQEPNNFMIDSNNYISQLMGYDKESVGSLTRKTKLIENIYSTKDQDL
ncbi:hypothetical protein [Kangiella sp. TOML190]|uniref:hypothetical protein n=1 Tax=Kangiella sp. TOML190 TaxID=2931351 RepID=UPI0020425B56|nr:hypothetical protein [Kangiella sp. TOML190]